MLGRKVLITGASGFVGSALARELSRDNQVYGLARFRDPEIKRELESLGVICIVKDVLSEDLDGVPTNIDYVFSQLVMIRGCEQNQQAAYVINTYFVGKLMEHCRSARGIVLGSTGAVYRPSTQLWREDGPIGPISTYGTSKFAGEALGTFLSTSWRIPTCILRYFYPYSRGGGLPHMLARRIVEGKPIEVGSRLVSYYDPIHMSDCVRFTIRSAELCSVPPRVLNVAGADVISWGQMVDMLSEALGVASQLVEQEADEPAWVADISLLKELLGEPTVRLREGLAEVGHAVKGKHL